MGVTVRSWGSCGRPTGLEQPGPVWGTPAQGRAGTGRSSAVLLDEPELCSAAGRAFPQPTRVPGPLARGRRSRPPCRGHQRALRARASRSGPGAPEPADTRRGRGAAPGAAALGPPTPPRSHGDSALRRPGTRRGGQGTRWRWGHSQGTATRQSSGHGGCPAVLSPGGCSGGPRRLRGAAGAVPGPASNPAAVAAPKGLRDPPMAVPRLRGCPTARGAREGRAGGAAGAGVSPVTPS